MQKTPFLDGVGKNYYRCVGETCKSVLNKTERRLFEGKKPSGLSNRKKANGQVVKRDFFSVYIYVHQLLLIDEEGHVSLDHGSPV